MIRNRSPPQLGYHDVSHTTPFLSLILFQAISRERIMPPPPLKQKILTVTDSVPAPPEQHEIEIYKEPSEGYGMRLGWKLYVQGVNEQGVAALAGVQVGDKIDRVSLVVCRLCFLQAV